MPPVDAGGLATQSPQVTSWESQPSLRVTSCKSMTSRPLKSMSVEQSHGSAHGSQYGQYIFAMCVCVCVRMLNTAIQALLQRLSPVRIFAPSPCSSLWVSLARSKMGRSSYIQRCALPRVHIASGMLCVVLQIHTVNGHTGLQDTPLILCLSTGICYLGLFFPLSAPLNFQESCAEVFISPLKPR